MKKLTFIFLAFAIVFAGAMGSPKAVSANGAETKGLVVSGVSFRDEPSTSSNIMRYLKKGEVVTLLAAVNQYWYQVKDSNGKVGYSSSNEKYIKVISNTLIIANVNFRPAPTTDSTAYRLLRAGDEMLVLEKVNDNWYRAQDLNGMEGYFSSGSKYSVSDFSVTSVMMPLADRIEAVISAASKYMGTPYEFGSKRLDTATFDCSDLMQQAFWDALKVMIPSDSREQGDYVKSQGSTVASLADMKRGDLVFFMSYKGNDASDYAGINKSTETITHVGIYLGNGSLLHTYSPESGGVRIDSIAGTSWEYRILFGGPAMK
ncbi:C40 family peptidase [Paenibacillus turpanensis]|uniref:C40 family peptidase n=1 Tax=Paenibacillus turpanensis TaxID=2689078 RepID=UPI00140D6F47|nr:C40 family peptidase [Paenibacillus turpanensis]